jgi:DNA replicative helicase MCM subunit Mcm2 (Cdc46/Mcm family)
MPKKQPTLGELFRGTVLDPYIEAARVRPLTDFTEPKSWIQPILEYITDQTIRIGWAEREEVIKEFKTRGAREDEVKQVLAQLEREGTIYTPREGFIRKT